MVQFSRWIDLLVSHSSDYDCSHYIIAINAYAAIFLKTVPDSSVGTVIATYARTCVLVVVPLGINCICMLGKDTVELDAPVLSPCNSLFHH